MVFGLVYLQLSPPACDGELPKVSPKTGLPGFQRKASTEAWHLSSVKAMPKEPQLG